MRQLILSMFCLLATLTSVNSHAVTFGIITNTDPEWAEVTGNANDLTVGSPDIYTQVSVVTISQSEFDDDPMAQTWQSTWTLPDSLTGYGFDLSAQAIWSVLQFDQGLLRISVDITNTTSTGTDGTIVSFGFATNPDTTASLGDADAGDDDDTFDGIGDGKGKHQSFPGGFKNIDACVFSANNCNGGDIKQGLRPGENDLLEIMLSGDFSADTIDLSIFAVKFQGEGGSYEFVGAPNMSGPAPVPVPGAVGLFLLGGLLMAAFRRVVG